MCHPEIFSRTTPKSTYAHKLWRSPRFWCRKHFAAKYLRRRKHYAKHTTRLAYFSVELLPSAQNDWSRRYEKVPPSARSDLARASPGVRPLAGRSEAPAEQGKHARLASRRITAPLVPNARLDMILGHLALAWENLHRSLSPLFLASLFAGETP